MNFGEYVKSMRDVPYSENLQYAPAVFWLHPDRLPLRVVTAGETAAGVVKVPHQAANKYGKQVPVIAIAANAFAGHDKITDIILPASINSLPAGAFAGCTALKRITLPKNIRLIRAGTFAGCDRLEDVYFEGTPEEWNGVEIVHHKHEIDFGGLISGTPVRAVTDERLIYVPGNEALLTANIHFRCALDGDGSAFEVSAGGKNITGWLYY